MSPSGPWILLAELGAPGCRVRSGPEVAAQAVELLAELGMPACWVRSGLVVARRAVELLAGGCDPEVAAHAVELLLAELACRLAA